MALEDGAECSPESGDELKVALTPPMYQSLANCKLSPKSASLPSDLGH
jgi:hypothetical protein